MSLGKGSSNEHLVTLDLYYPSYLGVIERFFTTIITLQADKIFAVIRGVKTA